MLKLTATIPLTLLNITDYKNVELIIGVVAHLENCVDGTKVDNGFEEGQDFDEVVESGERGNEGNGNHVKHHRHKHCKVDKPLTNHSLVHGFGQVFPYNFPRLRRWIYLPFHGIRSVHRLHITQKSTIS
jgi:hypothetical protein